MKRIVISGPISIDEFESNLERETKDKTFHTMTSSNTVIGKIDKQKRAFLIGKTGDFGISGGQMCFYGKYNQQGDKTIVDGKFDISLKQKIVFYIVFCVIFIAFITNVAWNGVHKFLAILIFHLLVYFLYKLFCVFSIRVFKKRGEAVIAFLNEILKSKL